MARWAMTLRSVSRPSTSCSLQPRRNEAACSAAIAAASRLRRFRQAPARRARTGCGEHRPDHRARQLRGVLRLGVGRAQIERLRRRAGFGRGGAEPRHPVDVGRAARIDQARRAFAGRPGRRQHRRRGADQARRAGRRRAQRLAQRREPRRHEGAAAGSEHLQIDVLVARVDRRDHRQRVVGGDQGRGDRRRAWSGRPPACRRRARCRARRRCRRAAR